MIFHPESTAIIHTRVADKHLGPALWPPLRVGIGLGLGLGLSKRIVTEMEVRS